MAKGCTKADRNRKSSSNAAYKSGNRMAVNKAKNVKKDKIDKERAVKHTAHRLAKKKPMRGAARAARRKKEGVTK